MAFIRDCITVLLAILVIILAVPAFAGPIFRYTDNNGITVITNVAPGRARRVARAREKSSVASVSSVQPETRPGRTRQEYDEYVEAACALYGIPPALARAVIAAESAFNPNAVSPKGALGLMQLMPATAAEMFVSNAFDPKQNIYGGIRYLRVLANLFDGDVERVVAAYNAGPEAVRKAGGIPLIAETQAYVRTVLRTYLASEK